MGRCGSGSPAHAGIPKGRQRGTARRRQGSWHGPRRTQAVAARRYPITAAGTHRNRHHSSAPFSQAERPPVFVIGDRSRHPLTPTWPVSGSGDRPAREPRREHLWTPSGMSILSEQAGRAICSRRQACRPLPRPRGSEPDAMVADDPTVSPRPIIWTGRELARHAGGRSKKPASPSYDLASAAMRTRARTRRSCSTATPREPTPPLEQAVGLCDATTGIRIEPVESWTSRLPTLSFPRKTVAARDSGATFRQL